MTSSLPNTQHPVTDPRELKEHRTMFDRFLSTRTGLAFAMSPFVALFAGLVAFLVHLTF